MSYEEEDTCQGETRRGTVDIGEPSLHFGCSLCAGQGQSKVTPRGPRTENKGGPPMYVCICVYIYIYMVYRCIHM